MSNDDMQAIQSLGGEERYDYFLTQVGEERELWILINNQNQFLKIFSEDDGQEHLPVWPDEASAATYAQSAGDLKPKAIALPDFFRKWVPGLSGDGLEVGVFPGEDGTVWLLPPEELKRDLQDEMSDSF